MLKKFIIFLIVLVFLIFVFYVNVILRYKKMLKITPKEKENVVIRKPMSKFKQLFIDLPSIMAQDIYNRSVTDFGAQGMRVFTGRQGSGKSIAMVYQLMEWQRLYPLVKVMTNFGYKYQDKELEDWVNMVGYVNGKKGVVVAMDEMQNWFSSNDSKNFPPNMLQEITQNRKQRRAIMGTAQVFTRLAKPLREQCTEVCQCITLLGCITIVRRVRPELKSDGEVAKYKYLGLYWFVHTKALREAYDTYMTIMRFAEVGGQERDYFSESLPVE